MAEEHVHSAGDTDPSVKAGPSIVTTEPVLLLTGVALLSEAGAAVALAARRPRAAGVAVGIGAVATAFAGARTHDLVTPMARPRDRDREPLTPLAAAEPQDPRAWEEPLAAGKAAVAPTMEYSARPSTS
jgi:hypothetical protein